MTGTMIIICGWCGCDLGTKPCSPEMDGQVSHGMCASCKAKFDAQLAAKEAKK